MSVKITDLQVSIGEARIIDSVQMWIRNGERVGLIGPSGSGKSMMSRAIMGLLPMNACVSGSIRVNGEELVGKTDREMAELRGKSMGMVFQNPASSLNPMLRVSEQIALPLKLHYDLSVSEREERVRAMMEKVQLPADAFSRFPHELSGGQQQRVGIATALITSPRLIIADEPTTALDSVTQHQIVDLLVSLVDDAGASMLFVTHDFSVLARATQYCYVLDQGRFVDSGPTAELLASPGSELTARLVASARELTLHGAPDGDADSPLEEAPNSELFLEKCSVSAEPVYGDESERKGAHES